jgi:hypothetical protein
MQVSILNEEFDLQLAGVKNVLHPRMLGLSVSREAASAATFFLYAETISCMILSLISPMRSLGFNTFCSMILPLSTYSDMAFTVELLVMA